MIRRKQIEVCGNSDGILYKQAFETILIFQFNEQHKYPSILSFFSCLRCKQPPHNLSATCSLVRLARDTKLPIVVTEAKGSDLPSTTSIRVYAQSAAIIRQICAPVDLELSTNGFHISRARKLTVSAGTHPRLENRVQAQLPPLESR